MRVCGCYGCPRVHIALEWAIRVLGRSRGRLGSLSMRGELRKAIPREGIAVLLVPMGSLLSLGLWLVIDGWIRAIRANHICRIWHLLPIVGG